MPNHSNQGTADMTSKNINIIFLHSLFVFLLSLSAATSASDDVLDLLEQCYNCHGPHGQSVTPEMPIIAGYSKTYIMDTMTEYRHSERPCHETRYVSGPHKGQTDDMCRVARELSRQETEMIGDNLSREKFIPAQQKFNIERARRGEKLHNRMCDKCHEDGGSSPDDDNGILAGQWVQYVRHQMEEFETGRRPMVKKMKNQFDKLDVEDMEDLVQYYASLQQRDKK